jgi:probable rRNA maturation factor
VKKKPASRMPALRVQVQCRDARWKEVLGPGMAALVRKTCRAAYALQQGGAAEMTVVLADDAFIRELNRDFRGKNKPTNVLSFPDGAAGYLGDMVLALEVTQREAEAQGKSFANHVRHLLVHGTLHLLGFDHETGQADAEAMEALEIKILAGLGVSNPYLY